MFRMNIFAARLHYHLGQSFGRRVIPLKSGHRRRKVMGGLAHLVER